MSCRTEARIAQYLQEKQQEVEYEAAYTKRLLPPQCPGCRDEGTVLAVVMRLEAETWSRTLAQRPCVCQLPPFDPGAFDALIEAMPSRPKEEEECLP